jgi:hypothetical protein
VRLRGGGDQEVGHLAAALVLGREQALDLPSSPKMIGCRLHQLEGLEASASLSHSAALRAEYPISKSLTPARPSSPRRQHPEPSPAGWGRLLTSSGWEAFA